MSELSNSRWHKKFSHQIVFIILLPLFFFGFSMLYDPFGIMVSVDFAEMSPEFHLLMLTSIMLVCLLITRSIFWLLIRSFHIGWMKYALWCIGEILLISCFMGLYMTLLTEDGQTYFQCVSVCIKYCFTFLVYPHVFMTMLQIIEDKNDEILRGENSDADVLVKFRDEHQRLKLTIEKNSVLYIRSDNNYLEIYYQSSDTVKQYLLRNSMKSQEENAAAGGFVRCHRSYYVNPKHIKMLGKAPNGVYFALLDTQTPIEVPVSRQYYDTLSRLL